MVTHFQGLPLAIVTLAGALIDRGLPTWRVAAKYLNERHLSKIEGMSEKVIGAIKFSFDYLRDDEKNIFLLCCLFPEDCSIELNVLMKYGMGLGLFVDGLSHTMDRMIDIAEKLKSRNLLLEGGVDGKVKVHDVTRDVALHIASEGEYGYLVKEGKEGRMGNVASSNIGKLREKHAISVLTRETNLIQIFKRDEEEYPDLHILRLQFIKMSWDCLMPFEFPTCFFGRIENLKILEICGMMFDRSFPGCLKKNLRTLCLYKCWVIDITEIGELTNLEILDLRGSRICHGLYGAVQRLSRLRVLDLTECSMEGLADNFVGGLPADQLEGLYLRNVRIKPKDQFMTCLAELEVLTHLEVLEVLVGSLEPVTDKFLSIFSKLSSFSIYFGRFGFYDHFGLFDHFGRFDMGRKETSGSFDKVLHFREITMRKHLQQSLGHLLRAANKLILVDCRDAPIMSQYNYKDEFLNLTYLSIYKCDAAEDFVISGRRTMKSAESIHDDGLTPPFAKLEHLDIKGMAGLRAVCAPNQHIVLSKLQFLLIYNCPLLRYVFTKSVATQLQQLKTIQISYCEEMEIIFTNSRDNNYTSTTGISSSSEEEGTTNCYEIMDDTHSIILPSLQKIELERLPHLKHFAARNTSPSSADRSAFFEEQVKFPELKNLTLLKLGSCEKIRESHLPMGSFGQLRELKIWKCDELRYIFSAAVARGLVQLEDLSIKGCSKLEEVVVMESVNDNEEENNITFPRLHMLFLNDLPHLKQFAARNTSPSSADRSTFFGEQVKFPELKNLTLGKLDSCEKIWESHLPTGSFRQLRELQVFQCHGLGHIFSAAVARGLVQLQKLDIRRCSKLEEVVVMESVNDNEEENNITFPRLDTLILKDSDSLHSFCLARNSVLEFPSLEEIKIEKNSNMQVFSNGSLDTPKLTGQADLNKFVACLYEEIKTSSSDSELLVDNQP